MGHVRSLTQPLVNEAGMVVASKMGSRVARKGYNSWIQLRQPTDMWIKEASPHFEIGISSDSLFWVAGSPVWVCQQQQDSQEKWADSPTFGEKQSLFQLLDSETSIDSDRFTQKLRPSLFRLQVLKKLDHSYPSCFCAAVSSPRLQCLALLRGWTSKQMRKEKPTGVGQRYGAMAEGGDGTSLGFNDVLLGSIPLIQFLSLSCSSK